MGENGNYYMQQTSENGEFKPKHWATEGTGIATAPQGLRGRALDISASPFRGGRAANTSTNAMSRIVDWTRYDEEGYSSEEALGENQLGVEKLGNALLNNLVIAGTTAVQNTIGLGWGLLKGIADGSSVWDNEVNRAMNSLQESSQESNPIYHSREYNEKGPLGRLLTTEFWADNLQSLGFTEGMLISSLIPGALLKNAGTAANIIGRSLFSSFGEAATEALNAKNDKQKLEETQALNSYKEKVNDVALVPPDQRDAYRESLYKDLTNDIANIRRDANTVGNAVLYQNIAILTLTGAGEFGPLFKRGATSAAAPFKQKLAQKGIKTFSNSEGALTEVGMAMSRPQQAIITGAKTLGRASLEGLEEFSQNVATKTADLYAGYNSFNNSRFNPESRELAASLVQSGAMAIAEAVKDKEVWTEFLSGMVTGFTGGPMVRSPKSSVGKWQSPITFEGATAEGIREMREYNRKSKIVNSINERLQDPKFNEYYEHLTRDIYLSNKINEAIDNVDDFNLKNYELSKVISDTALFEELGLLDNYKETVASFSNLDDEEIQQLVNETTSQDGKSGPYVSNGNQMNAGSIREKFNENSKYILEKIDRFSELKNIVTALHPELSREALENYLYGSIQVEDWENRKSSIIDELYSIYQKDYTDTHKEGEELLSKQEFASTPKIGEKLSSALNKMNPIETDSVLRKINDLSKLTHSIASFQDNLKKVISNPEKANKEAEAQKVKVNKAIKKNKAKNLQSSLDAAQTFDEIRTLLSDPTIDDSIKEKAVKESQSQKVKDFDTLKQRTNYVRRSLDGIEEQTKKDVFKILDILDAKAEDLFDLDTDSVLITDTGILREDGKNETEEELQERLTKANLIIFRKIEDAEAEERKSSVVTHSTDEESSNNSEANKETPTTGNSESPAPKPVSVPQEGTKAPDTADTNLSSEKNQDGQTEFFTKDSESSAEPSDKQASAATENTEIPREGTIVPSSSQYDLTGMNPRDREGNPKDVEFTPVAEAGQANHQYLSTNGPTQDAFNWINVGHLAKYKEEGRKFYFGIDPRLDPELPIVFVKTKSGEYYPIATLYKSETKNRQYGLTDLYNSLIEEFKANPTTDKPYVSSKWESSIEEVMAGRIAYTNNTSRDIQEALVGSGIDSSNADLVVNADNQLIGQSSSSEYFGKSVSGMSYIAVPNARRTTGFRGKTLVPVIPKNYSDIASQEGDFTKTVNLFIATIASYSHSVDTKDQLLAAVSKLGEWLNMSRVNIVYLDDAILIKESVVDEKGHKQYVTKDGKDYIKSKPVIQIPMSETDEDFIRAFKDALFQIKVPVRVNKNKVTERKYIKMMIDENLLKTFATSMKSEGAYFSFNTPSIIDSKDENPVEKVIQEENTGSSEQFSDDTITEILNLETVSTPKVPKAEPKKVTRSVIMRKNFSLSKGTEQAVNELYADFASHKFKEANLSDTEKAAYQELGNILYEGNTELVQANSQEVLTQVMKALDLAKQNPKLLISKAILGKFSEGTSHILTKEEEKSLLEEHSKQWLDSASDEEIQYALTCKGF